jgi:hypothetical protein
VFPQITPFDPVLYEPVIASKHGELILLILVEEMEVRAVATVDARNRRGTVPVVYEALRDSDPLEDRVWRAYQMATESEHSRTPIRVLNGHEQQARARILQLADVVMRQGGRARGHREAHEAGDLVRPASGRGAFRVEGLPGPSASHVAIAEVAGCVKGSLPGQRDRRAIVGYRGRDPACTNSTGGEVGVDDVPAKFRLLVRASRTGTRDEQRRAKKEQYWYNGKPQRPESIRFHIIPLS